MSRNIRTFNDLNGGDDRTSDNDSDGEGGPRGQDFYVGSGQQVVGPGGARNPNEVFGRVMESARANGADALSPEELARKPEGGLTRVTMYMWQNGFSIDDGPLRPLDDPANQGFLRQIMQGRVPAEIAQLHPGKEIDFHMERRSEEYVKPKAKPFSGSGVRLGNVVPTVVGEGSSSGASASAQAPAPGASSSSSAGASASEAAEEAKNLEQAKNDLKVDAAQPTTNIQVRLPNNQRIVVSLNATHTVSDVRTFLCTARPELIYAPFQLMTTYPSKVIDDESATLKDANLLGSALAVKVQAV